LFLILGKARIIGKSGLGCGLISLHHKEREWQALLNVLHHTARNKHGILKIFMAQLYDFGNCELFASELMR
jgi:hypothetical protein